MKKYFLNNLYIFKYKKGNLGECFIVEYDKIHEKYIEIFTGLKLSISNKNKLEPLSNYYSMVEIIGKLYKGDKSSLFARYRYINYVNNLLDYEKSNYEVMNNSIYNYIINNRYKAVGIKKYYLNNLFLVSLENKFNYICTYNKVNQCYMHVFTGEIINQEMIKNSNPLNECLSIEFNSFKLSSFTLLELYNAINCLEIYKKFSEYDVMFELEQRGIYEKSKIYKKLTIQ